MTPTEALATAHHTACVGPDYRHPDECACIAVVEDILAALPDGYALVSVDDVARRLFARSDPYRADPDVWDRTLGWVREKHRGEARRILGLEPTR